ncbi:bifunctional molybdenum cofactor biosynthesis protein MoaC/MoaB [Aridibaculum aurantiacum]|uniref:bifunctional molybdenum cofactor biosynthesis protein MoaC/MoaB n=1 Tax=Aridibaculum aurantiacum TaxID=2810307 RepID=UPI001A95B731|nr:bifunctional molybdenum cofactor biosynthesis protein MoaC/MoaB [Aridibaculum aurantiacum]
MVNITPKIKTLRQAVAQALVTVSKQETIDAIQNRLVPKGDVFEFSRAAGFLAVKKTSDVIPDCHPLPIEFTSITHAIDGLSIIIRVEVHTIYKTGVEVEAMHGASITALTMYDMLKPLDKEVEISTIKLVSKKGGKSQHKDFPAGQLQCAVVVCSDSVAAGNAEDVAGKAVIEKLQQSGLSTSTYKVIPDDFDTIQLTARQLSGEHFNIIIFTGGTGLSKRDVTPDAIEPLLDKQIPGIMEAARNYGQERTPYAMLSRGVAGFINHSLVLTLPGSTKGAVETMDALFPYILHVFHVAEGLRHNDD